MKGDTNSADYLSRNPLKSAQSSRQEKVAEKYVNYLVQTSTSKALPLQEIEIQTKNDATLQAVREAVTKGNWYMHG